MIQALDVSLVTSQYGPFSPLFSVSWWVLCNTAGIYGAVSTAAELWRTVPWWICHHCRLKQKKGFFQSTDYLLLGNNQERMACNFANGHLLSSRQTITV